MNGVSPDTIEAHIVMCFTSLILVDTVSLFTDSTPHRNVTQNLLNV